MQAFYRYPGPHEIGNYGPGVGFECACLPTSEIDRMVSEGWSLTPDDALAAHKQAPTEPEAVADVTEQAQEQPKRRGRPPKVRDDQEKTSG